MWVTLRPHEMLETLQNKKLIFVTGKGGVGKSTCSAAVAEALVATGRSVLVVETDSYATMGEMFGIAEPGIHPREARDGLWVVNLSAAECLVSTLTRFLPSERVVRAITQNRVTEAFFQSAPSVSEFVLLDQIQLFVEEGRWDHVLVDLPASGHAVTFLGVPKTLHGMMRGIGPIAKRADTIRAGIASARETAIVAVCLPEEMPVNETIELAGSLKKQLGRGLDLVIANMIHRAAVDDESRTAFASLRERVASAAEPAEILANGEADALTRLVAGNALALDWSDRDRHYLGVLREELDVSIIEIPMIYEIDDAILVREAANHLDAA